MHRDASWDIRVGFDRLRWTDDLASVTELYPTAKQLWQTGDPVEIAPRCVIPGGTFGLPLDPDRLH